MATSLVSGRDDAAKPNEQNRAELAVVLASETFKRSPKLSRLLLYLCEKYFQGLAGEITEYAIGIDVLGRNSSFDPQQDALVRVDTLHLRKRLKEYYATAGIDHEVRIHIPNGSYVPEFVVRQTSPRTGKEPETAAAHPFPIADTVSPAALPRRTDAKLAWAGGLAGLVLLAGCWYLAAGPRKAAPSPSAPVPAGWIAGQTDAIRIAAGASTDYIDHVGRVWMSDRFFRGGSAFHRGPMQIQRTLDGDLFRSGREGEFVYDIPLRPGIYELHLYFAETSVAAESLHGVSMAINSVPISSIDIASDAGDVNTATVKIYKNISPARDGMLHLTLMGTGPGFLNALEIVPGIPGKMQPIRLTAGDRIYRDHRGQVWIPDDNCVGGRKSNITAQIDTAQIDRSQNDGPAEPGLYQTYRVGHFNYSIPVVEGSRYTVRLHFTEPWFAQADPAGGIGSRVFDVYCNGTTLLKGFDILKEAGGGKRAISRVFHGVSASPQGKLNLTFVPVVNYALINAIEIFEQ